MHLESLGWDASFADEFRPFEHDGLAPARVAVEHRSEYVVYSQHGELRAELTGRLRHDDEHPAVGDWVAVAPRADEGRATIHAVAAAAQRVRSQSRLGRDEAAGRRGERRRRVRRGRPRSRTSTCGGSSAT